MKQNKKQYWSNNNNNNKIFRNKFNKKCAKFTWGKFENISGRWTPADPLESPGAAVAYSTTEVWGVSLLPEWREALFRVPELGCRCEDEKSMSRQRL